MFFSQSVLSIELKCDFEEVYKNGEINQGKIMIRSDLFRYQYKKNNLYTLILNKKGLFLKDNFGDRPAQRINQNSEIIKNVIDAAYNYPNIEKEYIRDNLHISIEDGFEKKFIKRLAIRSDKVNMALYFNNCDYLKINSLYFDHENFIRFND